MCSENLNKLHKAPLCWIVTPAERWWVRFLCQAEEIMEREEEVDKRREMEEEREREMKCCRH